MKTFNLFVICFLATLLSFASVSSPEKEALIALYNSTQGDKWNNTWDLNASVDGWYGVVVKDNKVVELNLQFNNLQGNLPETIGNLINLQRMNLGFNKIQGKLPSSIGNLSNLVSLEIFMNKLEGNIPNEIGNLTTLKSLLANNY